MSLQPHILVVEDDREVSTLVSRFLRANGMRVSLASDGRAMDKELRDARIDLIVLDVMLPAEDGLSICRRLRASSMQARVDQTIAAVPPGGEFVVISPVFRDYRAWNAKWTRLVWRKSTTYTRLLQQDPRARLVRHIATDEVAVEHNYFKPMQASVYRRVH